MGESVLLAILALLVAFVVVELFLPYFNDLTGTELALNYYFDEARSWRLRTRLRYRRNTDTGRGYFDYDRYRASQAIRFRQAPWLAEAEVRFTRYDYDRQPLSLTDFEVRERDEWDIRLRVERQVTKA